MNMTSEQLINNAIQHLDRAQGDVPFDLSERLTQQSIAYALIAIAEELHIHNQEDELERERQERKLERIERSKELW